MLNQLALPISTRRQRLPLWLQRQYREGWCRYRRLNLQHLSTYRWRTPWIAERSRIKNLRSVIWGTAHHMPLSTISNDILALLIRAGGQHKFDRPVEMSTDKQRRCQAAAMNVPDLPGPEPQRKNSVTTRSAFDLENGGRFLRSILFLGNTH